MLQGLGLGNNQFGLGFNKPALEPPKFGLQAPNYGAQQPQQTLDNKMPWQQWQAPQLSQKYQDNAAFMDVSNKRQQQVWDRFTNNGQRTFDPNANKGIDMRFAGGGSGPTKFGQIEQYVT